MPPDLCGQVGEVRRGVGTVQLQPELYARAGGVFREARVKRRHEGRVEGVDAALVTFIWVDGVIGDEEGG